MEPRASHQPRAPCPRTRTGLYQSDRVSLAILPLSVCFLLPLREWEGGPHLSLLWHRSWHPRHNLLREGGREGGERRRSSSFGGKHEVRTEGRKEGPRTTTTACTPPRPRGQARPASRPQQQSRGSASQHHPWPDSLSLSLPLSVLQGHFPGGGGGLRGRRQKTTTGFQLSETPMEGGEVVRGASFLADPFPPPPT